MSHLDATIRTEIPNALEHMGFDELAVRFRGMQPLLSVVSVERAYSDLNTLYRILQEKYDDLWTSIKDTEDEDELLALSNSNTEMVELRLRVSAALEIAKASLRNLPTFN
jgi:hypothetical protein